MILKGSCGCQHELPKKTNVTKGMTNVTTKMLPLHELQPEKKGKVFLPLPFSSSPLSNGGASPTYLVGIAVGDEVETEEAAVVPPSVAPDDEVAVD